jgi:molybdopterin-guanine dinucleotide biosynthesis protein A
VTWQEVDMDEPAPSIRVGGVVLCGGQSTRMGRPKAWLPFAGETMLGRVARLLGEVVDPVVVVAAEGQDLPPLPPAVRVVRDEEKGRGPLQGLSAGLAALKGNALAAYVSSCDVPFLSPGFVRRMIGLLGDRQICVPHLGEHYHPLAAVYRTEVLDVVTQLLAQDRLRPFFLFQEVPTQVVREDELQAADPGLRSLWNLNTPEEYARALRELAD